MRHYKLPRGNRLLKNPIILSRSVQKNGCHSSENDDSFKIKNLDFKNIINIAIADGATQSSFSKLWAQLLVENFTTIFKSPISKENIIEFYTSIQKSSNKWNKKINFLNLPWYIERKVKNGAYSTFLGCQINHRKKKCVFIMCGDSCIFQIRKNQLINSYPYKNINEFPLSPELVPSKIQENYSYNDIFFINEFDIQKGDLLFFTTDAMGIWFLNKSLNEIPPWKKLLKVLKTQTDFKAFIEMLRKTKALKNDDSTVISYLVR